MDNDSQKNDTGAPGEGQAEQPVPAESENERRLQELTAAIEDLRRQVETTKDQLLRKAAEFENYRRRTESDFASVVRNANENLITALIPIINDFVRSLAQGKDQGVPDGFYRGVELIYSKLLRVLEKEGLTPFESLGKPFDVAYHDALLMVPRSDVPPHTVIEEVERGYMLRDKVLRHAKVIVSTLPEEHGGQAAGEGADGNSGVN